MRIRVMLGVGAASGGEGALPAPAGDSRVTVDPAGPELFAVTPDIVAGNMVPHPAPRR